MTETPTSTQAQPGVGVQTVVVVDEEADLRLDRWFKRHFPDLGHGRLEKLLRTGQVRIDGKRAEAGDRLVSGQSIRVPPMKIVAAPPAAPTVSDRDARDLQKMVIYRDDAVIAINKPPGLAVQGGTGTLRHLDGMLDALRFGSAERPRLVHRLDRDTSGVLLLARTPSAAAFLAQAFKAKETRKIYWAVVAGVPSPRSGRIELALAKEAGATSGRERVAGSKDQGKPAVTMYETIESAKKAAWVQLTPITGRTHQLRVHCASIGAPILGDGKYGGSAAMIQGAEIARMVHLHARRLVVPNPKGGAMLDITAELPPHMRATWSYFGFNPTTKS